MTMLDLAKKINRKGDHFIKKHGAKEFHKKASELLNNSNFEKKFVIDDIIKAAFSNKHKQHFGNLEFSDLPVTIASGENCFIDIYFWRRRPTVIHNHHFTGAFMCLAGSNVDLEFSFTKKKKLGRFHDLGEIHLKQVRHLVPGAIAEIALMNKFIHQNHHQAELTINLCFRTPQIPNKSLSNYLYTGLRYEKNSELIGRVGRLLKFLDLGLINPDKLKIPTDDAIHFLIQTSESSSKNPRLIRVREILHKRIIKDLGLNISEILEGHYKKMDEIENEYE